jgi:hypothetical protein
VGDFALTLDELRVVARFVAEDAEEVAPLAEDPRVRAALDAAWVFVRGAPRTTLQRTASLDAHRAAAEASSEPARLAARCAGDAAAAYLHPLSRATQVGHILRASATVAFLSDDPDARLAQSAARADPILIDVLRRYPPAPTGRHRIAQLMAMLDTTLRR